MDIKGAFVWDQSGIRIIGIMQVSVRLAALPIPEYLDFHSGYSAPRSRIAGIYSRIYSYSGIFPNERPLNFELTLLVEVSILVVAEPIVFTCLGHSATGYVKLSSAIFLQF